MNEFIFKMNKIFKHPPGTRECWDFATGKTLTLVHIYFAYSYIV